MLMPARPWERVPEPVALPAGMSVDVLVALEEGEFRRLVRDHLLPRDGNGSSKTARGQWARLWGMLAADDDLADRTFDALEVMATDTEKALVDEKLSAEQARRARKFLLHCDQAADRLEVRGDGRPLAWAGRAGTGFNAPARKVIDRLVGAVAEHRAAIGTGRELVADQRLWAALGEVGLDPATFVRRREPR